MRLIPAFSLTALFHLGLATHDATFSAADTSNRTIPWSVKNNHNLEYDLEVNVTVKKIGFIKKNIKLGSVVVDTGSTGFLISNTTLQIPDYILNHSKCAFEYLSSSHFFYEGRWVDITVSFDEADNIESKLPVFVVTATGNCTSFTNGQCNGKSYNSKLGRIQYMGIGFGRWSLQQPEATPNKNVMLSIQGLDKSLRQGYIIDTNGITVGVSDEDLNNGWTNTKLCPNANSPAPESLPDWQGTPASVKVSGNSSYFNGTALFDTGISYSFLSVPEPVVQNFTTCSTDNNGEKHCQLVDNVDVTVLIGGPKDPATTTYSFTVGDVNAVPMSTPQKVVPEPYNGTAFINTGRFFYNAFSLLFDGVNGIVGLKPADVSRSITESLSPGYGAEYDL